MSDRVDVALKQNAVKAPLRKQLVMVEIISADVADAKFQTIAFPIPMKHAVSLLGFDLEGRNRESGVEKNDHGVRGELELFASRAAGQLVDHHLARAFAWSIEDEERARQGGAGAAQRAAGVG